MSMSNGLKGVSAQRAGARLNWLRGNVAGYFRLFRRKPRRMVTPRWRRPFHLAAAALVVTATVLATMIAADAPAVAVAQRMPEWLIEGFDRLTDFGKSFWFLVP